MRRRKLKRCKTGKVRYRDEAAAGFALSIVRRKRNGQHIERRYYYCSCCRGYHLTSAPAWKSEL